MALDDVVGRAADAVGPRLRQIGVRHDHLGERVLLEHIQEVLALRAGQVIESVAVLQVLHLQLEHRVEGRAEHAAKGHLLLGQAADPEIDAVEAAIRGVVVAGAVEEVEPIFRCSFASKHQQPGRVALLLEGSRD